MFQRLPRSWLGGRENAPAAVGWERSELLLTRAVEVSLWEAVLPDEVLQLLEELTRVIGCWMIQCSSARSCVP